MDITHHVEALANDLARTAEAGDEAVRAAAARLAASLEPSLRLTLMAALSEAAAEISAALGTASVDVRLRGRDPEFVVSGAMSEPEAAATTRDDPAQDDDDGETLARVTLRIPEALKARAEIMASDQGQSLNTWLVAAARAAVSGGGDGGGRHGRGRYRVGTKRLSGWAR